MTVLERGLDHVAPEDEHATEDEAAGRATGR
jgi:hypothetical protein